jgi:hypothetical protein
LNGQKYWRIPQRVRNFLRGRKEVLVEELAILRKQKKGLQAARDFWRQREAEFKEECSQIIYKANPQEMAQ